MISLNLDKIEIKYDSSNVNNNTKLNKIEKKIVNNVETINYNLDAARKKDNLTKNNALKPRASAIMPMASSGALNNVLSQQYNVGAISAASISSSIIQIAAQKIRQIKYSTEFANYAESFVGGKQNPLNAHTNWCLMFVSHCIKSNGSFESIDGFNLDEVSCSAQIKYINENNPDAFHLSPANYNNIKESDYIPKKGDIFFIENEESDRNSYVVRHVGIVDEVIKDENGNVVSITTIEGNVDGSSYYTSVVAKETYIVDDKGRFCFQNGNYVNDNCVIYGFFDTSSSINEKE